MFKRVLASLPGVGAALLPNVACPACWPVYAGVLSSAGLGFLMAGPYFYLIVGVMLSVSLFGLFHRAKSRRGYGPLYMGLAASITILVSRALGAGDWPMYISAGFLVAASIWNNWPKRKSLSESDSGAVAACPACKPTQPD